MTVTLGREAEKLIEDRLRRGDYATPEAVLVAALALLEKNERFGDFAPGEMKAILAQAEESGEPIDAAAVFAELRSLGEKSARNE